MALLCEFYPSVSNQRLPPPPQKQPIRNPLIVMNFYKTEADATISDADFQHAFPEVQLSNEPTIITISQHCEVTIALGTSVGLAPAEALTEIVISKHSY